MGQIKLTIFVLFITLNVTVCMYVADRRMSEQIYFLEKPFHTKKVIRAGVDADKRTLCNVLCLVDTPGMLGMFQ